MAEYKPATLIGDPLRRLQCYGCNDCGSIIYDIEAHNKWHARVEDHRHHFKGADGMPRATKPPYYVGEVVAGRDEY